MSENQEVHPEDLDELLKTLEKEPIPSAEETLAKMGLKEVTKIKKRA